MRIKLMITALGLVIASQYGNAAAQRELVVGGYPAYPPVDMRDPQTNELTGFDVDLINALSKKIDVKIKWSETQFAQLIPSMQTKRLDLFVSAMNDTAERQKVISFVDYLRSGTQLATLKAFQPGFTQLDDFCGLRIAASRATSIPQQLNDWSAEHCIKAGKPAMQVSGADNNIDARNQTKQGRVDAFAQDSLTVPYIMSQNANTFRTIGEPFNVQNAGIGVAKDNIALQQEVQHALSLLVADGTYKALLAKWQLPPQSAVSNVTINNGN